MDNRLWFYALALMSGLLGAAGDGFLNQWAKKSGGWYLILGYVLWNLALVLFTRLLKTDQLTPVVIVFLVANSVAILLIDYFAFQEKVSLQMLVGVGLAIAGVIVIEAAKA